MKKNTNEWEKSLATMSRLALLILMESCSANIRLYDEDGQPANITKARFAKVGEDVRLIVII